MKKEEKIVFTLITIGVLMVGICIGIVIADYTFSKSGISQTSYCKKVQIDTL